MTLLQQQTNIALCFISQETFFFTLITSFAVQQLQATVLFNIMNEVQVPMSRWEGGMDDICVSLLRGPRLQMEAQGGLLFLLQ